MKQPLKRFIMAIALGGLGYLALDPLFDRTEPYTRSNSRMVPATPHANEDVTVVFDIRTNRRCPGEFRRHVLDGNGVEQSSYAPHDAEIYFHPHDVPTFSITFRLPRVVPNSAGSADPAFTKPWTYYADGKHWCNVLQKWFWPIHSRTPVIKFLVLPPIDWTPDQSIRLPLLLQKSTTR